MDFQGGQCKNNGKFQGGHGKFDWKFRGGVNFKKIRYPPGGDTIFFWKSPLRVKFTIMPANILFKFVILEKFLNIEKTLFLSNFLPISVEN